MPYPSPVKYGFLLLISLTAVFVFYFPAEIKAYTAPQIFVTKLKINGVNGNEIKGEFTVVNREAYYSGGLNYEIKLFQQTSPKETNFVDLNVPKETFSIPPNGTVNKSFDYLYPINIISGDYTLRVQAIAAVLGGLGWQDQTVSLKGGNKFLGILFPSSKILVASKEYTTSEGVNVSPEETVTAFLTVKNPGEEITVIPDIKIFKRQVDMPLVKEYQDSPIIIASGGTKEINLEMPKFSDPESYLAEVQFYQNQEQVSGTEFFRWVVAGEGGKILNVKIDKDYYKAGDNMELTIESIGPADASDIGQGSLDINIFDSNGNLVAKTSKDVSLNSDVLSTTVEIPIQNDLLSPKIEVSLAKGGKVFDQKSIECAIFSPAAKKLESELAIKEQIGRYLFYLIILAIILAIGFLIYRFRKKSSNPFFTKLWKAGKEK